MTASHYVDAMSITILKDKEDNDYVDYLFISDVWDKDPRFTKRNMIVGQNRGLFRIYKKPLNAELLRAMAGDETEQRFQKALGRVLHEYQNSNVFPDQATFASG